MITIEQIGDKVIDRIKAFSKDILLIQSDIGPKTPWDEYKENYQYEENQFFNWEFYQDTINEMIEDEIEKLLSEDIDMLFYSIYGNNDETDRGEMHNELENSIFSYIHELALSEEIEYNSPLIKYVKFLENEYSEDDQFVVAEVIEKLNPSYYLLHVFSRETAPEGEQKIDDLKSLEEDFGLQEIKIEEFEDIKTSFYNTPIS